MRPARRSGPADMPTKPSIERPSAMTTTPNATPNYDALLQAASAILDAPATDIEYAFDMAGQLAKAAALASCGRRRQGENC